MRKLAFCICKIKGVDQLRGKRAADQRLCFSQHRKYISTFYIGIFKPLAIYCGCKALFVSEMVGNPEDMFCHGAAHMLDAL